MTAINNKPLQGQKFIDLMTLFEHLRDASEFGQNTFYGQEYFANFIIL